MYNHLFKPIKVNKLLLPNRIIAAPTTGVDLPEKAKSNAAINIVGCVNVGCPSGDWFSTGYAFSKYNCEKTRKTMDLYKSGGSYACAEIHHVGLWAMNKNAIGPVDGKNDRGNPYKMANHNDLKEIIEAYAKTCKDAKEFGYDMCMLHFGHGWLMMQFLSPGINKRTDEYGGNYENRSRFPLEVLRKVRESVGPDYPLDMRISAKEWIENGIEFKDVIHFIRDASKYIDMVNVSVGSDMEKVGAMHLTASNYESHCCNKEYAKKIKESVDIPVAVVGSIMTPEEADNLIKGGYCDLVTIGRALIADPYWIKKAYYGKNEEIRPCIRCNNCMHWSTERRLKSCSVNPRVYREDFVDPLITEAQVKKRVVVVGGGPAGMRAAITAKDRGHEVFLIEKEDSLGGKLNLFTNIQSKTDLVRYKNYLINQIKKKQINLFLNTKATSKFINDLNPNEVILAIGAEVKKTNIKGAEKCQSALEVFQNIENTKKNIVIIGGGSIGCELAIELAKKGKKVTIIQRSSKLHQQVSVYYDLVIDEQIKLNDIKYYTNTDVVEIYEDKIEAIVNNEERMDLCADQVILAIGLVPKFDEVESFYDLKCPVHVIGDCYKVGKIKDTTDSAFFVASNM